MANFKDLLGAQTSHYYSEQLRGSLFKALRKISRRELGRRYSKAYDRISVWERDLRYRAVTPYTNYLFDSVSSRLEAHWKDFILGGALVEYLVLNSHFAAVNPTEIRYQQAIDQVEEIFTGLGVGATSADAILRRVNKEFRKIRKSFPGTSACLEMESSIL